MRRTDKTSEASYHDLYEYMQYAEDWFDEQEYLYPGIQRRIYLATDEPSILKEAKKT